MPRTGTLAVTTWLLLVTATACESNGATESVGVEPAGDSSGLDAVIDDIDCSVDALTGGDDGFLFTSAHPVVEGVLGDVCFGVEDPVILDAWDSLVTIAPPGQLGDVTLFAGFEPDGDVEADTLAFVNSIDADGTQFQMSVNTVEAVADPDELLLTLAHEFTHVFTATSTQLDRTLIVAWVDEFWAGPLLDSVDPLEDSPDDAEARCGEEDGFFGSYAATNPEEDFAEAFSAFVFDVDPATDGQVERLAWIERQPGLSEFRERAVTADLTPLDNNFDVCGT